MTRFKSLKQFPSWPRWRSGRWMAGKFLSASEGNLLLEAAVAVMVFGTVGSAVLIGIQTAHSSGERTETQSVAEIIARNQMEDIFNQAYKPPPASYTTISVPSDYTVTAAANEYISGSVDVEKLVVTVGRGGRDVLALETLRAGP